MLLAAFSNRAFLLHSLSAQSQLTQKQFMAVDDSRLSTSRTSMLYFYFYVSSKPNRKKENRLQRCLRAMQCTIGRPISIIAYTPSMSVADVNNKLIGFSFGLCFLFSRSFCGCWLFIRFGQVYTSASGH